MTGIVQVLQFPPPPVNRKEILRYMGAVSSPETEKLIEACLGEAQTVLTYRVCYGIFPLSEEENGVRFPFAFFPSQQLKTALSGCEQGIVFAATVGVGIDRLIARAKAHSPAKALCLHAIGAERVESLCDTFLKKMEEEFLPLGQALRPRFSPGYGDLTLSVQTPLFQALDCPRKIGLTLNESLLMSPSKSVTAIVGVEGERREQK